MTSGVYKITNKLNGKFYVGSAKNCFNRWSKKYNNHLESAFLKYGKENFIFEIVEECEEDKLIEREQYWLDNLKPFGLMGYNQRIIADSNLGSHPTETTKEIWSKQRKGRKLTEEWKENIRQSLLGREITWKEKIREANSGENNYNYGKHLSDEWKEKLSIALKNKPKTEDHKRAISEGKKGKKFSEEHKKKLSEAAKLRHLRNKLITINENFKI